MSYVDVPQSGGSTYWQDAAASFASLPAVGNTLGQVRAAVDTGNLYEWNGSAWALVGGFSAVTGPAASVDGEIALFNSTTGKVIKRATGTGFVKATSGVYGTASTVSLTSEVAGILPVANGGTNSSTALLNNRVMQSTGDKVVEAAAITASRVLISDANGIPTHNAAITASRALVSDASGFPVAATPTTTEINYVAGVSSAIQTQFSGKEPTISSGTSAQFWRGDKIFVTLNVAAMTATVAGTAAATGAIGEVLTASQATNTTTGVGSTGVWGNATSVSLTAGSWMVWGCAGFNENGATLTAGLQCGISASSTASGISEFDTTLGNYLISSTSDGLLPTPHVMVDIFYTDDLLSEH
jgi:hypothetical protein